MFKRRVSMLKKTNKNMFLFFLFQQSAENLVKSEAEQPARVGTIGPRSHFKLKVME